MKLKHIFTIIFTALTLWIAGQPTPKKIGLVLSGGGAKGFAHIGVLQVLQEAGVPIQYIGGASMGSIIGGLYAIGYTPDALDSLVKEQDWTMLLSDKFTRYNKSIEEKMIDGKYIASFPIDKKEVALPGGLVAGQNVHWLLSQLTTPAYQHKQFKDFPIPFTCVAADVVSGRSVILNKGDLATAMRSSMAIPTLFSPVVTDSSVLVDGGLFNNYPVEEVCNMGAEIIIGVDVQSKLASKDELKNVYNIMNQSMAFLRRESNLQNRARTNILIRPDIQGYNMLSFTDADTIIARGRQAALAALPHIIKLLDSLQIPLRPSVKTISTTPLDSIYLSQIRIKGLHHVSGKLVKGKIDYEVMHYVKLTQIEQTVKDLHATGYFKQVNYELESSPTGNILIIRVLENKLQELKVGIHFDNEFNAALLINHTIRNLVTEGSKLSTDLALGSFPRFKSTLFANRGHKPGLLTSLLISTFNTTHYEQNDNTPEKVGKGKYSELKYNLGIGLEISRNLLFSVYGQLHLFNLEKELSTINLTSYKNNYLNYGGELLYDNRNQPFFATHGNYLRIRYLANNGKDSNTKKRKFTHTIFAEGHSHVPINRKISLTGKAWCGITLSKLDNDFPYMFYLGGNEHDLDLYHIPFDGLNFMEKSAYQTLAASIALQHKLYKNYFLTTRFSAGQVEENAEHLILFKDNFGSISLGMGYNSPIGPINLNFGKMFDRSNILVQFQLGFIF